MILFLLASILAISVAAWSNQDLMKRFVFNAYLVKQRKEYYRFLSSGFLHSNWIHLGFNLFVLYQFSNGLRYRLFDLGWYTSDWEIVILFLLGVILSEVPSYFRHQENPHYNSLGASGGVSSVVFTSIMLNPVKMKLGLIFIPVYLPAFLFGILYLIYSHFQSKQNGDNINHDAHLYGALFGVVFAVVYYPETFGMFLTEIASWDGSLF